MSQLMTRTGDVVFDPIEVDNLIASFGDQVLMMGARHEDVSLAISIDCYEQAAHLLGPSGSLTSLFIEGAVEARKQKISVLTDAVQNAATDTEAKRYWQELEYVLFGV